MPKKKNPRHKLSLAERKSLRTQLEIIAKHKSMPAWSLLAKRFGVSETTIRYYWLAVKKARKAKVVTPAVPAAEMRSFRRYSPRVVGQIAQGMGTTLMTSSTANGSSLSPSIKAMVDLALEKELLTLRKRIEEYVNEAMRK